MATSSETVTLVQVCDPMSDASEGNGIISEKCEALDVTSICSDKNESVEEVMGSTMVGCSDDVKNTEIKGCSSDATCVDISDKSDDIFLSDTNACEVHTHVLDLKTEDNMLVNFAVSPECQETVVAEISCQKCDNSCEIGLDSNTPFFNVDQLIEKQENKVYASDSPKVSHESCGASDLTCIAFSNCSSDNALEKAESKIIAVDAKSFQSSSVESSMHCDLQELKTDSKEVMVLMNTVKEKCVISEGERFSSSEVNEECDSVNERNLLAKEDKSVKGEITVENISLECPRSPENAVKDFSCCSPLSNEGSHLIQFPVKSDSNLVPSNHVQPSVESPYKDNSLVKKMRIRKKKTKDSVLWPSPTPSADAASILALQNHGSEEHSYSVEDLNKIFNSWTITDVHPRKKYSPSYTAKRFTPISTTSRLDSHFRFDFALPEEYSRNLTFCDSLSRVCSGPSAAAAASASASKLSKAAIKEKKDRKKEDKRKKKRAAAKVKEERQQQQQQHEGGGGENRIILPKDRNLQELPETVVRTERKASGSAEGTKRSKSADGSEGTQGGGCGPHSASKSLSQTLSLDHLNEQDRTPLTPSCPEPAVGAQVSKPKRNKNKKTLIREVRNSKFGITQKHDELGQLEKIANRIIKGDRKQSSHVVRAASKKKSNSIPTMEVQRNRGSPLPSSPTKKEQTQSPKKKIKKTFEEYWSVNAVKEGIQNGTVIESPIRINPKNYTEAYVTSPDGGQDILIEGIVDRNRALEGDLVALLIKNPEEWKKAGRRLKKRSKSSNGKTTTTTFETAAASYEAGEDSSNAVEKAENSAGPPQMTGKVVAILSEQHSRRCVGYLKLMKNKNDKFALFSPRDARIPRMHIPRERCPTDFWSDPASKQDIIYLAKIKKWLHGMFALGEILEQIGEAADPAVETTALLMDNDLDVMPYPETLSSMIPVLPEVICEEEVIKRLDLRKECIFTIDPMTAKDLDDAVSCKELENGNLEVGVHISDVTYFLLEGTLLDNEVATRATSVYLVDKVHHMLPLSLCLQCSLLPGRDKLAYSVIWEMTKDATIVSQKITRSIIHSCAKLAYEHAQVMLENPDDDLNPENFPTILNGFSLADISKAVKHLQKIAVQLKSKRFDGGALRIDQTKVFVHLNEQGIPVSVEEYIHNESHGLIEEFMLLANMTTAKFIYEKYPNVAFLRCHPFPHKWLLEGLQEAMASRGIHLNVSSAGALQASLSRYAGEDFLSKTRLMVLNALCARTMARAKYFCAGENSETDFWHYALSVPFYTHFTSPIRRYADVMVHRLLNAALGYSSEPKWTQEHVASVAANCNKKKYSAKMAGEQSVKLYLALYVRYRQPVIEDAVVIDVKDHSFDVNVCSFGLAMRVYVTKMDVELCYDSNEKVSAMRIKWSPTDENPVTLVQVVELFSIVSVKVVCEEKSLKLEASLLPPSNHLTPAIPEDSVLTEKGVGL